MINQLTAYRKHCRQYHLLTRDRPHITETRLNTHFYQTNSGSDDSVRQRLKMDKWLGKPMGSIWIPQTLRKERHTLVDQASRYSCVPKDDFFSCFI